MTPDGIRDHVATIASLPLGIGMDQWQRISGDLLAAANEIERIRTQPAIVDDMQGLYSHASDVYRAGQSAGRQKFFDRVSLVLSRISVKYEVKGTPEQFHVAEECCGALRATKIEADKPKHDTHPF